MLDNIRKQNEYWEAEFGATFQLWQEQTSQLHDTINSRAKNFECLENLLCNEYEHYLTAHSEQQQDDGSGKPRQSTVSNANAPPPTESSAMTMASSGDSPKRRNTRTGNVRGPLFQDGYISGTTYVKALTPPMLMHDKLKRDDKDNNKISSSSGSSSASSSGGFPAARRSTKFSAFGGDDTGRKTSTFLPFASQHNQRDI